MLDTDSSEYAVEALRGSQIAVLSAFRLDEHVFESSFHGSGAVDGKITCASLSAFVSENVQGLSRDRQHLVVYAPDGLKDLVLGVTE
jgi:hypothetical protein